MRLFYFDVTSNFGDALNPWLWPQLLGPRLAAEPATLLVGIGTILNQRLPAAPAYRVFGSGCGYGPLPAIGAHWRFHAVRGPLTAQALGLAPDRAVTDAAYLLADVPLPAPRAGPPIGFMPHADAMPRIPWRRLAGQLGLRYIDPFAPVPEVLGAIRGCECLVTEAMHGAIVADLCRVPWLPVATGGNVLAFKWRDWLGAMELPYTPRHLANLRRLTQHRPGENATAALLRRAANALWFSAQRLPLQRNLRTLLRDLHARRATPCLSTDAVLRHRTDLLRERLAELRRDLAAA